MAIIDKPSDYFNTITYSGNGSNPRTLTGVGFQPDWVWQKNRTDSNGHTLADAIRGANKTLSSDGNGEEVTDKNDGHLDAFTSDGFTVGAGSSSDARVNDGSHTYVAWNWKAGTSFTNDASATGIGSLDSSGSVNEEAGFAIVSYTGNETASTLKHGLSTVPQVIIVKGRVAARDWIVGHHTQAWTTSAMLNETTAYSNQTHWNNTAPTSSVFTIEGGTNSNVNTNSAAYIAYVFSERQGYSKFGSYTGNGGSAAEGPFIYTGFKPAWFMTKKSNGAKDWNIYDNKRSDSGGGNANDQYLEANNSAAEQSGQDVDLLSNGVKIRATSSEVNGDGNDFIYMAFAENPFVTSSGVPATAR
jgi:hypothetical protein